MVVQGHPGPQIYSDPRQAYTTCADGLPPCPSRVASLAGRWLHERRLVALPCDKEPGFCLVPLPHQDAAHEEILSRSCYTEILPTSVNIDLLYMTYCRLCRRVGDFLQDDALASNMRNSLYTAGASHSARLITTVKSTKGDGLVTQRNVHASSRFAFAGAAYWVAGEIQERLDRLPHLLTSGRDFVNRLRQFVFPCHATMTMIRIDLKEFFMSGRPEVLARFALEIFNDRPVLKSVCADVVLFLLTHQLVSSTHKPGRLWRVDAGSGMGLPHSGPIADAALYGLAERSHACQPCDYVHLYVRFRDDIFLLHSNRQLFRQWYSTLQRLCFPTFTPEVVEVSQHQVTMLDVDVTLDNCSFRFAPRQQANPGQPLSVSSAHPPGVHMWPLNRLRAIWHLCSDNTAFLEASERFINRFRTHFAPRRLIEALHRDQMRILRNGVPTIQPHIPNENVSRLVLEWHPAWRQDTRIKAFLAAHVRCPHAIAAFRSAYKDHRLPPRVQLVWRVSGRRLVHIVSNPAAAETWS